MSLLEINKKGNRQFGYFNESELKISSLDSENIHSMMLDQRVLNVLNFLRQNLNAPVRINSMGRSKGFNAKTPNAAKNSYHLIRTDRPVSAVDSTPVNRNLLPVYKNLVIDNISELESLGVTGIGFYPTFIHLDCGNHPKKYWGLNALERQRIQKKKI